MKTLLAWIDQQRSKYGNIVLLVTALILFTFLAIILGLVYALFIGLMYLNPYLVLAFSLVLVLFILYKNRPPK